MTSGTNWKPNLWITMILAVFALPLSFLYVGKAVWASVYIGVYSLIALAQLAYFHRFLSDTILAFGVIIVGTSHVLNIARRIEGDKIRQWYTRWHGLVLLGTVLVSVTVVARAFVFETFRIPSTAMLPTLPPGSSIVVSKWGYGNYRAYGLSIARTPISSPIRRGDVFVFEYPRDASLIYVKRVIGLPGDRVSYVNRRLSINGKAAPTKQIKDFWHSGRFLVYSQFTEALDGLEYKVIYASYFEPLADPLPQVNVPFSGDCTVSTIGMDCKVPPGHLFVLGDNRDNSSDSRTWGFLPLQNIVGKVVRIFP